MSDVRSIDDPVQTGTEESSSALIFAESVEFEQLFRYLEVRLDLDPCFDLELCRDAERGEGGSPPFDRVERSCDVSSKVVEFAGALDSHE